MSREDNELGRDAHMEQFAPDWPFTESPKPIPGIEAAAKAWEAECGVSPLAPSKIDTTVVIMSGFQA